MRRLAANGLAVRGVGGCWGSGGCYLLETRLFYTAFEPGRGLGVQLYFYRNEVVSQDSWIRCAHCSPLTGGRTSFKPNTDAILTDARCRSRSFLLVLETRSDTSLLTMRTIKMISAALIQQDSPHQNCWTAPDPKTANAVMFPAVKGILWKMLDLS